MSSIGELATRVLAVATAKPIAPLEPRPFGERPLLVAREADFVIPERVFSNWIPARGDREIRRALTVREREVLDRRSRDLTAGLYPLGQDERELARSALHAMFGGFRSLRQTDENAENSVEVLLAVLGEFPAWAIEEGCLRIATNQTSLSDTWPPSDPQIHAVVAAVVKPFRETLKKIDAVLDAHVEALEPVRPPAPELTDPSLLRAHPDTSLPTGPCEPDPVADGKHAQRVMAELEAKRLRREQNTTTEGGAP